MGHEGQGWRAAIAAGQDAHDVLHMAGDDGLQVEEDVLHGRGGGDVRDDLDGTVFLANKQLLRVSWRTL